MLTQADAYPRIPQTTVLVLLPSIIHICCISSCVALHPLPDFCMLLLGKRNNHNHITFIWAILAEGRLVSLTGFYYQLSFSQAIEPEKPAKACCFPKGLAMRFVVTRGKPWLGDCLPAAGLEVFISGDSMWGIFFPFCFVFSKLYNSMHWTEKQHRHLELRNLMNFLFSKFHQRPFWIEHAMWLSKFYFGTPWRTWTN